MTCPFDDPRLLLNLPVCLHGPAAFLSLSAPSGVRTRELQARSGIVAKMLFMVFFFLRHFYFYLFPLIYILLFLLLKKQGHVGVYHVSSANSKQFNFFLCD